MHLEIFQHRDHNLQDQDQDQDQDQSLLVRDRSCNKTKASNHITTLLLCALALKHPTRSRSQRPLLII